MKKKYRKLVPWVAAVVIVTAVFATLYGVAQQSLRLGANDPQIEIAEDTAAALNKGTHFNFVDSGGVDVAHSLSPFIVIYNQSGKVVSGSGKLGSKVPTIPLGVLKAARGQDYNFVTWQPAPNVRLAAVAVATKDGYVVAARSLKEVEKRENHTLLLSFLGWLVAVAVVGGAYWLQTRK